MKFAFFGGEGGLILAIFVPTFYVGNPIAT